MHVANSMDLAPSEMGTEQFMRRAVMQLLDEVQAPVAGESRRDAERMPFFGPVAIRPVASEHPRVSAFTRDISASGIGLLHIMPLALGEVVVELSPPVGPRIWMLTEIVWCHSCGEGWYTSGGRFIDILRVWMEDRMF